MGIKGRVTLSCGLVILLSTVSAFATLTSPPSWRGASGTTWAEWEFSTNDKTPPPDNGVNPYGSPSLVVHPIGDWQSSWGGRDGIWPLSGMIEVTIPNTQETNPYKFVQIELIWAGEYPNQLPCVSISATLADGSDVPEDDINLIDESTTIIGQTNEAESDSDWHQSIYLYKIVPNPIEETITIGGAIMVDSLMIDTICTNSYLPEPTSLAIALLGGLVSIIRKKY